MDENEEITDVRIAYANLPPFVAVKDVDGMVVMDGFMPAIIRKVTQWMKLNVTWIREPDDAYGFWNGTTFTGLVGMIYRNEVDLIMNPILPNNEVFRIIHFTNPIIVEAFTALSGKERKGGGLFLYFSVLQPLVWSFIGITLIAIACVSIILYLRLSDGSNSRLVATAEYIWVYVAYMLRQAPNEKWMLRSNKSVVASLMPFLMVLWMICIAFLVMNVFQSLLVSKLAIIKQYPVVDSLQEFVNKKHVIGLTPKEIELQLALDNSGIPVYDQTWAKLKPHLVDAATFQSDETLAKVEKGRTCMFHGHLILRTILSDYFKRKGRCNFHLSENYFYPFPLVVGLKKSFPQKFVNKFNFGVTRLVDADISGKWFKTIYEICHFCTSYSESDLKPLSIKNILGVLVIWGVGMTSATISLIVENLYFKSQIKKGRKKKRPLTH